MLEIELQRDGMRSRFSCVWIDRTCRLRCSLLLKHFAHPSTLQMYARAESGGDVGGVEGEGAGGESTVGTFRPRLCLVRFGTGRGGATRAHGPG